MVSREARLTSRGRSTDLERLDHVVAVGLLEVVVDLGRLVHPAPADREPRPRHRRGPVVRLRNLRDAHVVFTFGDARSFFDAGVKMFTLNPMVEFLTSAQKTTARQTPNMKPPREDQRVRAGVRCDEPWRAYPRPKGLWTILGLIGAILGLHSDCPVSLALVMIEPNGKRHIVRVHCSPWMNPDPGWIPQPRAFGSENTVETLCSPRSARGRCA